MRNLLASSFGSAPKPELTHHSVSPRFESGSPLSAKWLNWLIVDIEADLDKAVLGILHSAFGDLDQQCSVLHASLDHYLGDCHRNG